MKPKKKTQIAKRYLSFLMCLTLLLGIVPQGSVTAISDSPDTWVEQETTLGNLPVGTVVRDQNGYTAPWIVLSQSHFGANRTLLWEQETRIARAFTATFVLSWSQSEMRQYLRTEFYNNLSARFQDSIMSSTTHTDNEMNSDETVFILSLAELGYEHLYSGNTPPATDHGSKIEGVDAYLHNHESYWTRSAFNPMTIYFYYADGFGSGHLNFTGTHVATNHVRAAVNLQSDTAVYGPYGEEGYYTLFDPLPFAGGSGEEDDPYLIATARHLHNIREDLNAQYRIVEDINLEGRGWEPIGDVFEGGFEGALDGQGFTISGLTISLPGSNQALFGHIGPQGSVSHLYLEDVDLSPEFGDSIAGLAARNEGMIHDVHVTGQIHGDSSVGGLVAVNTGTITASSAKIQLSGENNIGGLVGDNRGRITQSFARGTVIGEQHSGGLVGFNFTGAIHDSFSEVTVQGSEAVGGLAGFHSGTAGVESSYALGSASGEIAVGGLIGRNYGNVETSYWNENAYAADAPDNEVGVAVTAEALNQPSTFAGWDFDTVWYAYPGKEPFLQWMDPLIEVEVNAARTQLTLRDPMAQLNVQAHHQSGASYGATQTARYEVTDGQDVVEVDSHGEVTAKTAGEAVITVIVSGEENTIDLTVQVDTVVDVSRLTPIVVEYGTERSDLTLPEQVEITLSGGEIVETDVTWDTGEPEYSGLEARNYRFTGELSLPLGVVNASGAKAEVLVIVLPLMELPAIEVPFGTERSALPLPNQLEGTGENGETISVDVTWDDGTPTYNRQQPGTYRFEGVFRPDPALGLPATLRVHVSVTVQARVEQPGPILVQPGPPSPGPGNPGGNTPDEGSPDGDSSNGTDSGTNPPPQEPEQPEVPTPQPVFEPMDMAGHWAADSVRRLIALGAISGYPDHTFRPNAGITRAEFVTVLVKALKLEARVGRTFTDTEQHWAAEAISTAHEHGLINGYSDTHFGPNDPITREQIARILQQAFQIQRSEDSSSSFMDQSDVSPWAIEAVNALAQQGVLTGYSDRRFLPKQGATRAEAAVIVMRALQLHS
ncbi:S-layer homology domain-containing protein [Paenibacillus daejeonensis]|uniref:S-layer homology domain-containing protein n=1 Tax=Paenibacillus daejeonensis TaxID=135193 RepID=UPI000360DCD9|nr:S-layer homology domain-containing protein [Paenibacillus daejeonensis]